MKPSLFPFVPVVLGAILLLGVALSPLVGHPDNVQPALPAPTAENSRSWTALERTTTTAPVVPRMEPVAGVGGNYPDVWTICDHHGHRLYVLDGEGGGITALDDPSCPVDAP